MEELDVLCPLPLLQPNLGTLAGRSELPRVSGLQILQLTESSPGCSGYGPTGLRGAGVPLLVQGTQMPYLWKECKMNTFLSLFTPSLNSLLALSLSYF